MDPVELGIERMRRRHLRRVMQIEAQAGQEGRWSAGLFLAELRRGEDSRCYVVAKTGPVVGFAGLLMVGGDAHVTTIAVDESYRRQGVGARLMLHLADTAVASRLSAMTLEVRADNEPAIALYRRFGFAPAGVRRDYYRNGVDALVMWASDIDGAQQRERLERIREETTRPARRPEGSR